MDLDAFGAVLCIIKSTPNGAGCLQTVGKLLSNICQHPNEEKFRTIKKGNAKLQQTVLSVDGAVDLLMLIGWTDNGETLQFYRPVDEDLQTALALIQSEAPNSPAPSAQRAPMAAPATNTVSAERNREIAERQRKEQLEKQKILSKVRDDQSSTHNRVSKDSEVHRKQFGTKATTWKDIGVDCNKAGG